MKVRYRPRAKSDLDDIFQYLNERSPTGARHVLGGAAELPGVLDGLIAQRG